MDENEPQNQAESGGPTDAQDATLSRTLDLLANTYRRIVLEYLVELTEDCVTLDRLVERVLEREARTPGSGPTAMEVRTELYHVHLPKLSAFGIVTVEDGNTVEYCPDPTVEYLVGRTADLDEETTPSK